MLKELKTKQGGFTLVELAIVMVIIGLLIGGILKGQELIKNAAISATAAQIKAFESAFVTFEDIYQAKPGDFAEHGQEFHSVMAPIVVIMVTAVVKSGMRTVLEVTMVALSLEQMVKYAKH